MNALPPFKRTTTALALFWAFIFCCPLCRAQDNTSIVDRKISSDVLQTDFAYFREVLERIHPSIYRYQPKDSVKIYLNQAEAQLTGAMNEFQYWELLQSVIAKIGSAHTRVLLSPISSSMYMSVNHYILPFKVFI